MRSRIWTGQDRKTQSKSTSVKVSLVALIKSTNRTRGHGDCHGSVQSPRQQEGKVPHAKSPCVNSTSCLSGSTAGRDRSGKTPPEGKETTPWAMHRQSRALEVVGDNLVAAQMSLKMRGREAERQSEEPGGQAGS